MVTTTGFPRQIVTEHTTLDMATRFFKAPTQFQNEIISAGMKGRFETMKPLIGWVAWLLHHYIFNISGIMIIIQITYSATLLLIDLLCVCAFCC
jgi:hypothetical protein